MHIAPNLPDVRIADRRADSVFRYSLCARNCAHKQERAKNSHSRDISEPVVIAPAHHRSAHTFPSTWQPTFRNQVFREQTLPATEQRAANGHPAARGAALSTGSTHWMLKSIRRVRVGP